MPIFQSKARTVESYLAGAGASGALLAGAFIMFVLLVGAATFDSWPHYGHLLPGGDVTLDTSRPSSQAPVAVPVKPSRPLRGKRAAVHGHGRGARVRSHGGPQSGGELGGNRITPGVTTPPSSGQNSAQPSAPSGSASGNVVQQAVSNVGSAVESDTASLGSTLGATSPVVGDTVTRLGSTLNGTLQKLAGTP